MQWLSPGSSDQRRHACVAPSTRLALVGLLVCASLFSGNMAGEPATAAPPPEMVGGRAVVPERQVLPEGQQPAWKGRWDLARALVRQKRYVDAVAIYRELLALRPDVLLARRELAFVLLATGDYAGAVSLFESLEREGRADAELLAGLARARVGAGDCLRAVPLLERLSASGVLDDSLVRQTGVCLLDAKVYDQAVALLDPYLARHPDDVPLRGRLARLAAARQDDELARRLLQPLVARDDVATDLLVLAARIHVRLGLDNLAAELWRRILARDPSFAEGHRFLAAYAAARHDDQAAFRHRLWLWRAGEGRDAAAALELGRLAERLGRRQEAVRFYEEARARRQDDLAAIEGLVRMYAALGDKAKTLAMLEQYLAIESRPASDKVRQAARLYADRGLLARAVRLYQALLAEDPDDPELLRILAHDLLALGRPDEALAMWRHLAAVRPDRLENYTAMADLLERLGRVSELAPVLERIVALDPGNVGAALRLAELRLAAGDRAAALALYQRMADAVRVAPADRLRRARLAESFALAGRAFDDYLALWRGGEHTPAVLAACLRTGGAAGELATVRDLVARIEGAAQLPLRRAAVRALLSLSLLDEAGRLAAEVYAQSGEGEDRALYVETLVQRRLFAEAEEVLRLALLQRPDDVGLLLALTRVALAAGEAEKAERWLDQAESADGERAVISARYGAVPAELLIAIRRIEWDALRGKKWRVGDGIAALLREAPVPLAPVLAVDLASLAFSAGRPDLVQRLAAAAGKEPFARLTRDALLLAADDATGLPALAERAAGGDRSFVFRLADTLLRLGRPELVERLAALCRCQGRWPMTVVLARAEAAQGKQGAAADRLMASAAVSSLSWPQALAASWSYAAGRFANAAIAARALCAAQPNRPDYRLLYARALWAAGQRSQALEAYRSFLAGGEKKKQAGEMANNGEGPLWSWAWLRPRPASPLEEALLAQEEGDPPANMVGLLKGFAAGWWQRRFALEYGARHALERGDLHRAARSLRRLVVLAPDDDSFVFDLARTYDRLDRRQEAAGLYGELRRRQPDYPGLAEALAAHRRARRPRTGLAVEWGRLQGWDDHQAVSWWKGGMVASFSPSLQHAFTLDLARVRYRASTDDHQIARAGRLMARYSTNLRGVLALTAAVGRQKLDLRRAGTTLLAARVDGEFGDRLAGYLAFDRDAVADTLTSLAQGIVREEVLAGVRFEPTERLRLDGDYRFADFSDGNVTEEIRLGAVLTLRRRSPWLALGYHYRLFDSRDTSLPGVVLAGSSGGRDHPYWTPRNYWLNNFTVYYKQGLLPEHRAGGPFVDARWSLGHDAEGHARQRLQLDLGWDLPARLSCRVGIDVVTAPREHGRRFAFSLEYRW